MSFFPILLGVLRVYWDDSLLVFTYSSAPLMIFILQDPVFVQCLLLPHAGSPSSTLLTQWSWLLLVVLISKCLLVSSYLKRTIVRLNNLYQEIIKFRAWTSIIGWSGHYYYWVSKQHYTVHVGVWAATALEETVHHYLVKLTIVCSQHNAGEAMDTSQVYGL